MEGTAGLPGGGEGPSRPTQPGSLDSLSSPGGLSSALPLSPPEPALLEQGTKAWLLITLAWLKAQVTLCKYLSLGMLHPASRAGDLQKGRKGLLQRGRKKPGAQWH